MRSTQVFFCSLQLACMKLESVQLEPGGTDLLEDVVKLTVRLTTDESAVPHVLERHLATQIWESPQKQQLNRRRWYPKRVFSTIRPTRKLGQLGNDISQPNEIVVGESKIRPKFLLKIIIIVTGRGFEKQLKPCRLSRIDVLFLVAGSLAWLVDFRFLE